LVITALICTATQRYLLLLLPLAALQLLMQLAMAGDAEAMVRVSHMLLSGYGTQQDHTAAARWMRQAW
jgi:TPR repeat protein